jgi:hypothetical protein
LIQNLALHLNWCQPCLVSSPISVLHDKCSVESILGVINKCRSPWKWQLSYSAAVKRGKTALFIRLVTMDKHAGVEGSKQAVVQYIFASETNNLALENIKIPGSSWRQVGWRVTDTTFLLPNVDFVSYVTGGVDLSPDAHYHKVVFKGRLDSVPVIFKYVLHICLIIVQWQQKNVFGIAANRPRYPALIELNRVHS